MHTVILIKYIFHICHNTSQRQEVEQNKYVYLQRCKWNAGEDEEVSTNTDVSFLMFCGDGWCGLFCRLNGIAGALEKTESKYKQVICKGKSGLVQVGEQ